MQSSPTRECLNWGLLITWLPVMWEKLRANTAARAAFLAAS